MANEKNTTENIIDENELENVSGGLSFPEGASLGQLEQTLARPGSLDEMVKEISIDPYADVVPN